MLKEFVEYLVKNLVDNPEEVKVTEVTGEHANVYEVRVGKGDMGKVIGKRGQNARSIRTLLNAVAAKDGKRAVMEILE